MTRTEAREEAFILIFEKEFNDIEASEVLSLAEEVRDITADDYIKEVFFGVCEKKQELDDTISENLIGWNIKRIPKTSLAILRLAIYEIKYIEQIPNSVSINEAVELAKKYSTKDDSAFINGILSTIVKAS